MKKILQIALLVLMLAALLVLVPSGAMVAQAEILELPADAYEGLPPQKSGYLSDWAYEDPSISVSIETGRYEETNYMVAHVKLANATQLRTAMASNYYNPSTSLGTTIAKRCNAVLAINGDFFSTRNGVGLVTRQGKEYRLKCNGDYDVLIIDDQGDLHILPSATNQDVETFAGVIMQGFTFGPGLIIQGEKQTDLAKYVFAAGQKYAQRMCLAQIGPLEYLCICSEGPEDKGSVGLTLDQFCDLVSSFEGIQNAYNLDGGSSSTMVFRNQKINSPNNPKRRPLCDIIYFASAYQPDGQE